MRTPVISVFRRLSEASQRTTMTHFKSGLCQSIVQFCEDTTLHGLKHLMQNITLPVHTKNQKMLKAFSILMWIIIFLSGVSFAIYLMVLVWTRFQTTPTITTVETNNYPIWNLKFPAVTICNNNKVYAPAADNLTQKLISRGLNATRARSFFRELNKLVTPEMIDDTYNDTLRVLLQMNYTVERLMFDMMEPCTQLMHHCSWLGKPMACDKLFRVATSAEGFCCSFNYKPPLDPSEVDTLNDFIDDTSSDPEYRVSGAGQFVGLDAFVQVGTGDYVSYGNSYYGVSILVHGSDDFPQQSDRTAFGQPGDDVTVAVVPTVVVSEPSVRGLQLGQRNCYFDDEVDLNTSNKYTYKLCIAECAVQTIINYCQCLPFYYPEVHLLAYSGNNRQCTLADVNCLRKNRHIFSSLQPDDVNETIGMDCSHCLPSCSTERYEVHTMVAHRNADDGLPSVRVPGLQNLTNFVSLRVHFKDITCIKYRRDIILTWDGLFASFGGIFGLCLGGSVISLIELIYHFTFQCFNVTREDQQDTVIRVVPTIAANMKNLQSNNLNGMPKKESAIMRYNN